MATDTTKPGIMRHDDEEESSSSSSSSEDESDQEEETQDTKQVCTMYSFSLNPCSPEGFSQTYFPKGGCCNPPWIINSLKWRERMNLKVPGAILPLGCAILSTRAKTVRGVDTTPLRTRVNVALFFEKMVNWWGHFSVHLEVPISFSLAIGPDYSMYIMLLWVGCQSFAQQACYLPSLCRYPSIHLVQEKQVRVKCLVEGHNTRSTQGSNS